MQIFRPQYIQKIHDAIQTQSTKILLLHGGRGTWKTTILKQFISDTTFSQKRYYFSFEEDIVAKRFKNADDFRWYMQIKYGINFHEHNILLLNEIQYSKNIISVLQELLEDLELQTTIIATGIIQTHQEDYNTLIQSWQVKTITIHPLGFFNFLDHKDIHTTYLNIDKPSQVMFKEIQLLFDEYLIRWWYPEVIKTNIKDRKQYNLKAVIQKVYDKDVGFYFNGDAILAFQDIIEYLCYNTMTGCKYKTIAKNLDIDINLLKKYIQFLDDNCLINTLPYFFTDKKRELSHQETIVVGDMGIKSYMTQSFGSKLHDIISIKNFIYAEIIKWLPQDNQCMTYQKINNSSIDFIIIHADNTITAIIVSDSNTDKAPKVFKGFHQQYGDRVKQYIKTTPLIAQRWTYNDTPFICVPHFMIKVALWY